METINEKERITLTLLADTVKIHQGTLSNYISGNRTIPYNIACVLESITGIFNETWLKASWGKNTELGKRAFFILRKQLGLAGTESERKLANDILRENFNKYIEKKQKEVKKIV